MSPVPGLRTSLVYVLIYSLVLSWILTLATHQSYASHNTLLHSSAPTVKESSDETGPQTRTVDEATRSRVHEALGKLPLSFEENRGQVDSEVKYISRGAGYTLFLTPTEAVLALRRSKGEKLTATADARRAPVPSRPHPTRTSVLRMKLKGANQSPAVTGESELGVRVNYFKGNDPQQWQTDVARHERVRYTQVYPGIDMIYYGQQQQLEYDFEVAPFADTSRIALEFKGVTRVKIEKGTGDVLLKTASGEVRQHKPVAYQEAGGERREVESRYVMQGQRQVGIKLGEYDRTRRLVIDPALSYSTYLGGNALDFGYGIAVDTSGNVYVTGITTSTDFPTLNEYQSDQAPADDYDAFVTKLNPNLSGAASLLYSTYLGSADYDSGNAIAVDSAGIAYVTGTAYNGVFVMKFDTNATGAASLLYSIVLGNGGGIGIAADSSGMAYIMGYPGSGFPMVNQYQTCPGLGDVFVTKLDTNAPGGGSILYSTCLGGSDTEYGSGIAVDSSGHAYVTGLSYSSDFPLLHQYQTDRPGADAFVTKLDTNATGAASLLYSTYLGGNDFDYGLGIAADAAGNAYVTGETHSSDFPKLHQLQGAQDYDPPGVGDAFVTKLNTNLSGAASLRYSTYLGGYGFDYGTGIAVDSAGMAYVTGSTTSANFPARHQHQAYQDGWDVFVTKLDTNLSGSPSLIYGTFMGGADFDYGTGIAVDSAGAVYVTGYTYSSNFPVLHAYQAQQGGDQFLDAFVAKLVNSHTISGRVTSDDGTGIGGVTLTFTGSHDTSVLTSSNGTYAAELPVGGNYTVTPSRDGVAFLPSEQSFSDLEADQMKVDFTTQPATISGKITVGSAAGAGMAGVRVTLTGGSSFEPRSVNTSVDGSYLFSDVPTPGDYTIKAAKTNYSFSPAQRVLPNLTDNQTGQNFFATLKSYTISGMVKLGAAGLAGVTLKLSSPTPAGFATRTATTNSSGAYSFANVPAGRSYIVTPTRIGYEFTPTNRSLANLSADRTGVNFAVTVYSITGRITRSGSTTGIGAVTMTLTSPTPAGFPARTVMTTGTGAYTFTNVPAGRNYTLKPTKMGFTFSPATRSITNLSNNIPAGASTNFTGAGP